MFSFIEKPLYNPVLLKTGHDPDTMTKWKKWRNFPEIMVFFCFLYNIHVSNFQSAVCVNEILDEPASWVIETINKALIF